MTNIYKQGSSLNITGDNNSYPFLNGKISLPLNSLYFVIDESNVISFKQVNDNNTLLSVNINNLQINGEQVTKENLIEKFDAVANGSMGGSKINAGTNITLQPEADGSITISATGELGGTVAWQDVTDKPSTFTPSAHNHVVADITDLQGKLDAKQDTLVSGTNIKTINGQTLLGEGNIEIQGGGSGISDAPSDDKLYGRKNANWSEIIIPSTDNFATKSEIADMLTKTEAASAYQPKGDYLTAVPDEYVTETELSGKGYLTEIPSEYVTDEELNAKGYATTSQLDGKLSVETYNSDKATFATKEELADKANTSDLSNYLQTSVAESTYAKKSEIPEAYSLPIATAEALGGIKVGAGLSINPETGVLNATGGGTADSVDWANITSKPETFTPSAHNHPISDITDLQDKLDAKADTTAIADMATKTWVGEQGFLTEHQDISQLATKQEVTEGLAGKQDKGDYALKSELPDISNLATKEELSSKANTSDLSNYVTTVNAEATYAKKSEIPSLEGYLQTSTADEKYATKAELEGKVDDADIADMLTKTEAASTYQPKGEYITEIPAEYITESELDAKGYKKIEYLTQTQYDELPNKEEGVLYVITDAPEVVIPDTSDMLTKTEASSTYQPKGEYATASQLSGKQDTLVSGTNIKTVNGESILGSGNIEIQGGSSQVFWDLQTNSGNTEYITNFYNNVKVGDAVKYNNVYNNNLIISIAKNEYSEIVNCVLSPRIENSSSQPNYPEESIWIQATSSGTLTKGYFFPFNIASYYNTIEVKKSDGNILIDVSEDLRTKINDSLSKTEASTTYALQSALQAALERIAALEAQVGNISTQLDNINGEVIN